jgi:hypothetical protein
VAATSDALPSGATPDTLEAIDVLESIDTLAALEVIGAPRDQPPETDQMQLF